MGTLELLPISSSSSSGAPFPERIQPPLRRALPLFFSLFHGVCTLFCSFLGQLQSLLSFSKVSGHVVCD